MRQPSESDGRKLKSTMKEGLDLDEELKIETTADVSRLERNLESHDTNDGNRLASTAQSLELKSRQDLHDHLATAHSGEDCQHTYHHASREIQQFKQKHSSSTRAASINPPSRQHKRKKERKKECRTSVPRRGEERDWKRKT